MPPANTAFLSNNDREFIVKARCSVMLERLIITHHPHVQALAQDVRLDGRAPMAKRPLHIDVRSIAHGKLSCPTHNPCR